MVLQQPLTGVLVTTAREYHVMAVWFDQFKFANGIENGVQFRGSEDPDLEEWGIALRSHRICREMISSHSCTVLSELKKIRSATVLALASPPEIVDMLNSLLCLVSLKARWGPCPSLQ